MPKTMTSKERKNIFRDFPCGSIVWVKVPAWMVHAPKDVPLIRAWVTRREYTKRNRFYDCFRGSGEKKRDDFPTKQPTLHVVFIHPPNSFSIYRYVEAWVHINDCTPRKAKPYCRHNWVFESHNDFDNGEFYTCSKCGKIKFTR